MATVTVARKDYFDRVVVINLRRRPDRLAAFWHQLQDWPFKTPEIFSAVDGEKVGVPSEFRSGGGAWGCQKSHLRILECALMDDIGRLLVLEDDAVLCQDFAVKVEQFLAAVPPWDQLMLGGQHITPPEPVSPGVVKCLNCQRTHCYAIQKPFMQELYKAWSFNRVHVDWTMGPMQRHVKSYASDPFLIGQNSGHSDITCRENHTTKFWIPPSGDETILVLHCPRSVVAELRQHHGIHTGHRRNKDDLDVGLVAVFKEKHPERKLKAWVQELLWECRSEQTTLAVWHPKASLDLLRRCWSGPVLEIRAESVEEVLQRIATDNRCTNGEGG